MWITGPLIKLEVPSAAEREQEQKRQLEKAQKDKEHMGLKVAVGSAVAVAGGALPTVMGAALGVGFGTVVGLLLPSAAAGINPAAIYIAGFLGTMGAIAGATVVDGMVRDSISDVKRKIGDEKNLTFKEKLGVFRSSVKSALFEEEDYYRVNHERFQERIKAQKNTPRS